jgi:transketolase
LYKELISDPKEFARQVRMDVAKINCRTRDSHIGGGYSAVDIMAVLYTQILGINRDNLNDPNRNIFILSKGHIAATMFAVLANAGIIPYEDLDKHLVDGENYAGHTRKYMVPGIEMSAGSLGHGSCMGCGMAYAKRMQGYKGNVYVLMGDGECNEGSVWESAMFAARFKLSNLVFIVDRNHLQAYGSDENVLNMGVLSDKFRSFGCRAIDVDGHDYDALYRELTNATSEQEEIPTVIVADTIKGKGVSFMENRLEWHFKSPNEEQLQLALEELSR